eukprot:scaffold14293_cov59-Attheya_sp.AAC.3
MWSHSAIACAYVACILPALVEGFNVPSQKTRQPMNHEKPISSLQTRSPLPLLSTMPAIADIDGNKGLINNADRIDKKTNAFVPYEDEEVEQDQIHDLVSQQAKLTQEFTPFQTFARIAPIATFAAYRINPEPLDNAVTAVWDVMKSSPVTHVPLFEADVAVFGFFAWIVSFSCLHLFMGEAKTMQSRFDGQMPHDPFEWAKPQNWQLWFNPIAGYLGSIWVYHLFHHKEALTIAAPAFGIMCADLLFGIVLYDLLFYPIHYAYHNLPIGKLKRGHGYHHRSSSSDSINAIETVQHSYIDGFLQVAVNILVQNISPFGVKHTLTRILHNLFVTYLLTESHSGYDLPWMSHRIWPEVLGGSLRHEKHHHDGKVYYHQFFMYLDDTFGFTKEGVQERRKTKSQQ